MSVTVRSLRLLVFATAVLCLQAIRPAGTELHSQVPSTGHPSSTDLKASPPRSSLARLPVEFVENRGQWNGSAKFVARQERMTASLEPAVVTLRLAADRPAQVSLTFDGASKDVIVTGEERRSGRYNFFLGSDPSKWQSNVAAYGAVRYRGLYPGVDLRVLHRDGGSSTTCFWLPAPTSSRWSSAQTACRGCRSGLMGH